MGIPHWLPSPQNALIRLARCPTDSVILSNPWPFNWRIRISRIGISPMGTSGFGMVKVNGRSRLPFPPARINARMAGTSNPVDAGIGGRVLTQEVADLPEPLGKGYRRRVAERRRGARVVADQPAHLALRGPHSLLLLPHRLGRTRHFLDLLQDFADGKPHPGADVVDVPLHTVRG